MAHPRREQMVASLLADIGDVPVVWDRNKGRWDTGRRAMLAYDPDATHHLVIQDDAIVCRDLLPALTHGLAAVPAGSPVGLYLGRTTPFQSVMHHVLPQLEQGAAWLVMSRLLWGVGVVMPAGDIIDMVRFADSLDIPEYDGRISQWAVAAGRPVWYPWPSLVDHRISPSLVPGRTARGRYAYRFIGADRSAGSVDWGGRAVSVPPLGSPRLLTTGGMHQPMAAVGYDSRRSVSTLAAWQPPPQKEVSGMAGKHDPTGERQRRIEAYVSHRQGPNTAARRRKTLSAPVAPSVSAPVAKPVRVDDISEVVNAGGPDRQETADAETSATSPSQKVDVLDERRPDPAGIGAVEAETGQAAEAGAGEAAEAAEAPPEAGRGSTVAAWQAFLVAKGFPIAELDGLSRQQLIELSKSVADSMSSRVRSVSEHHQTE